MRKKRNRAFSLLEVMVAIGLLSLMITIVMSAQGGLVRVDRASAKFGTATTLARCRMTEIEEKLLKFGYVENDEIETSNTCCDDRDEPGFVCEWKIEKVILPPLQPDTIDAGSSITAAVDGGSLSSIPGLSNIPGTIGSTGPGATIDLDGGLQNIGNALMQQSMGGSSALLAGGSQAGAIGLLRMVFTIVYPSLKPLLELTIRRITVTVKWRDGLSEVKLPLTQFYVNPLRAGLILGFDGGVGADGGAPAAAAATGGTNPASAVGTATAAPNPLSPKGF